MLKDLENDFSVLERRILSLKKDYQDLQSQLAELTAEHKKLQDKLALERRRSQQLEEEHKSIKLHSAISGNPDHNRLMKNHINRLIKEVDLCIAELQHKGL